MPPASSRHSLLTPLSHCPPRSILSEAAPPELWASHALLRGRTLEWVRDSALLLRPMTLSGDAFWDNAQARQRRGGVGPGRQARQGRGGKLVGMLVGGKGERVTYRRVGRGGLRERARYRRGARCKATRRVQRLGEWASG